MSGAVSGLQVLVIGLDPHRVPGPWDPQPVADAIEASMLVLSDEGVDAETCLIGLDGSENIEVRITAALKARPWDCVLVGGGIRKSEELLELFESIVNLVRCHAPDAEIAFNSAPPPPPANLLDDFVQDILGAVARRFRSA